MQEFLANSNTLEEKPKEAVSLWSRSGPTLLLAAFAIFLFKSAPLYWPLVLAAFLGYAIIHFCKKKGFVFSLIALSWITFSISRNHEDSLWTWILFGSIALAWFLIYLGNQDIEAIAVQKEQFLESLYQERQNLEKGVKELKSLISSEKERSVAQFSEFSSTLAAAKENVVAAEEKVESLSEKNKLLTSEISAYQEKQTLLKQLQCQFSLLREQFEEKTEALNETRKALFAAENELWILQKLYEEEKLAMPEEIRAYSRDFKTMENTCQDLENQILNLQELITVLIQPKTRSPSKKTSKEVDFFR